MDSESIVGKPSGADFSEIVITLPARLKGLVRVRVEFAAEAERRRHVPTKRERTEKREAFLALIVAHPTMVDHPDEIAERVGVTPRTIYNWIAEQEQAYREQQRR